MVVRTHTSEVFALEEGETVELEFSSGVIVSGRVTSTNHDILEDGYLDSLLVDVGDEVLSISRQSVDGEFSHSPVREKGYVVSVE